MNDKVKELDALLDEYARGGNSPTVGNAFVNAWRTWLRPLALRATESEAGQEWSKESKRVWAEAPLGQEWVSVSDRLPTHIHSVLIRVKDDCLREDYTDIGIYNDVRGKWQVGTDGGFDVDVEVTHWMPLPAAPSANAEGNPNG